MSHSSPQFRISPVEDGRTGCKPYQDQCQSVNFCQMWNNRDFVRRWKEDRAMQPNKYKSLIAIGTLFSALIGAAKAYGLSPQQLGFSDQMRQNEVIQSALIITIWLVGAWLLSSTIDTSSSFSKPPLLV